MIVSDVFCYYSKFVEYLLVEMMIYGAFQFYLKASANITNGGEGKKMIRREEDGWKIDFSGEKPPTPLLDTINYPAHMKNLSTNVYC